MSTCRSALNETGAAFHSPARGPIGLRLLAATAVVCFTLVEVAQARPRDRDRRAAPKPAAATPLAIPNTLTKSMAIEAVIDGLAINGSPAAEKTLEQIVTGEIPFGGHSKQAAQEALLWLALRPTPAGEAFLLRLFTDPDNAIRVGDPASYPPEDLRADASHVLAKVASPKFRLELAKLYTQSSTLPAVRSAIEEMLRAPSNANFAAQVEVFRSPEVADAVKAVLQKILIEKNAAAVKSALRLESDANAKGGVDGALPFSPSGGGATGMQNPAALLQNMAKMMGAMPGLPGATAGNPLAAALKGAKMPANTATAVPKGMPAGRGAKGLAKPGSLAAAATPALMMLEMIGQMQNLQPVDPATVAQDLWKPEFVESLSKRLSEGKSDESPVVSALASLPIKAAREKLKEYLHKERNKGPEDLGKAETTKKTAAEPTLPPAANMRRRGGRRRKDDDDGFGTGLERPAKSNLRRFGIGAAAPAFGQSPTKKEITEFDNDWYDPGSLVVLKTVVTYQERPPEKPHHRSTYQISPQRMTPYMEKRMREKVEKQQALESTYEWRDAIEKSVRQWNERLGAVAEAPAEPAGAGDKSSTAEDKPADSTTKTAKSNSDVTAKAARSSSSSKTPALAPAPTPAVAMPFALHAGGTIAKEYHLRWPQDLPAGFTSATSEPLAVDYLRLQGPGEFGKALTHYRSAITAVPGGKPKIFLRQIENGKWLDTVQKDSTGHKTRSIDVLVTREAGDDDKDTKSKDEEVTVEILCVEIETPGQNATPGSSKKEARETTSTTSP
jgi:hypothetical protein